MLSSLRARSLLLMFALGTALLGCAGAPVQEMSNARQAIKAAREAGAVQVAPQVMSEAQSLLERAELNLQRRAYGDARRDAVAARTKATEAMGAVQLKSDTNGSS